MMQNYGIVRPGNSSAMLTLFHAALLNFYFRPNGLNDALFILLFAIKKFRARVTNCLASTIPLNFSSLFRSLRWRAVIVPTENEYRGGLVLSVPLTRYLVPARAGAAC